MAAKIERWSEPEACCDPEWEAAYARVETPSQEAEKFLKRLTRLGADGWQRELQVVDIFCGRGGGLKAWETLGFRRLEGVDLSENLLRQYSGDAHLFVGDCRRMAFPDDSRDVWNFQRSFLLWSHGDSGLRRCHAGIGVWDDWNCSRMFDRSI